MLFLFFLYYLVHGASIEASPIASIDPRSLALDRCTDLTHCRTIWNIVWSCLATIFSCTWVAVHPNIPCPKKQSPVLSLAEHRLPLFICALLVPEYVLAWAIRQFMKAWRIAKERRWSMTHGFFIVMGGFHLFEHGSMETSDNDQFILQEDDIPLHPLAAHDLYNMSRSFKSTEIDFFSFIVPTEAEIEDKGKSNWLAKLLVLLQTSWFVLQCIARAIEHLPVTHLEIVTLAYAAMNFVMYIFWWHKPLNVNRPVRVFRRSEPSETQPQVRQLTSETQKLTWEEIGNGVETLYKFIGGLQDGDVNLSREDRAPMFWADSTGEEVPADLIMLGVGVCFGAIHCIAWSFSFPTHTELLVWRTSCIAITAVPVYIPLMFVLALLLISIHALISIFPAFVLYILARGVTLILAFTSLRDLPPGAYEAVRWTTFMPHI